VKLNGVKKQRFSEIQRIHGVESKEKRRVNGEMPDAGDWRTQKDERRK
jgi:hypothetical protein